MFWFRESFVDICTLGHSPGGRPLTAVKIGQGKKRLLLTACHHAKEYLTGLCLWSVLERYCTDLQEGKLTASCAFAETTVMAVPWVNPDGAAALLGLGTQPELEKMQKISGSYPAIPFPEGWKANLNGVDLNLNYPARWEQARERKAALGFTAPAPRFWCGESPLSQPETQALARVTEEFSPETVLALHSQGEEIYGSFGSLLPRESRRLGEKLSAALGYPFVKTPADADAAGYKDWFLEQYKRPGFTVELGLGENPLPLSRFPALMEKCIRLFYCLTES